MVTAVLAVEENPSIAGPVLVVLLLAGSTIMGFGYLLAVARRANSDYKKVKAGLPGMRKDFWRAWWAATKVGFFVILGAFLLITWAVRDVRDADAVPSPSRSVPAKVK
jgi:hypothetical protein